MVDRVRPLKMESPNQGGTQTDLRPRGLKPNEDYVDVRGVAVQNDFSNDTTTLLSRDAANNLTFSDGVVAGTKTLTQLLGGAAATSFGTVAVNVNPFEDEIYGSVVLGANPSSLVVSSPRVFDPNYTQFIMDYKLIATSFTLSGFDYIVHLPEFGERWSFSHTIPLLFDYVWSI